MIIHRINFLFLFSDLSLRERIVIEDVIDFAIS